MNNALCITTPGLGSFGMRRDSLHAAGRWNGELTARGSRKRCGIGQLRQGDRTAVHVQRTYEGEELANSHKPASPSEGNAKTWAAANRPATSLRYPRRCTQDARPCAAA